MNLNEQLKRATEIAIEAHSGQVDRNGQPYLGHVFRVMNAGHTLQEKIVGALHDVIEDSDLTLEDLKTEGFPKEILDAVNAMTYDAATETYNAYLKRVIENRIAVRVKINDLTDNMDLRRLDALNEADVDRLKKYFSAYQLLVSNM